MNEFLNKIRQEESLEFIEKAMERHNLPVLVAVLADEDEAVAVAHPESNQLLALLNANWSLQRQVAEIDAICCEFMI